MPFATRPNCGTQFHLVVTGSLDEWYARYAPGVARDQPAPLLCLACRRKVRAGTLNFDALPISPAVMANLRRIMTNEPTEDS